MRSVTTTSFKTSGMVIATAEETYELRGRLGKVGLRDGIECRRLGK
jgi:hypothetical protein